MLFFGGGFEFLNREFPNKCSYVYCKVFHKWRYILFEIHKSLKLKMSQQLISKINGVDIVAVDYDDEIFVPVKPICEAIGIDVESQRDKIQDDEILSSTAVLTTAVAVDGKEREMYCLPLRYVYGWIFTINPKNVAPDARESVTRYRRECYDALYEHFTGSMQRTIETNNAEIELLNQINSAITEEKEAKTRRKKA